MVSLAAVSERYASQGGAPGRLPERRALPRRRLLRYRVTIDDHATARDSIAAAIRPERAHEGGTRPLPLPPICPARLLARCPSVRDGRLALRPNHPSARKLGDFDQAIAHYRAAAE